MFVASSVYFHCVSERAAYVKKTVFLVGVNLGRNKSLISLVIECLSTTGVL